jgi:thioester reductase-like protein
VVAHWPGPGPAPEAALASPRHCFPQGYSHAKYAAEQIVAHAVARRPSLRAAIVRCGQIAGALRTGAWPRSEYVPRLILSSQELGIVPDGLVVRLIFHETPV